jgi:predicted MFS family arabinose efflux permease
MADETEPTGQTPESSNVRGFLRVAALALLPVQLLPAFSSGRPLLTWLVSIAVVAGVLREAGRLDEAEGRRFSWNWALILLALPVGALVIGLALDSNYFAELAGASFAAPGIPAGILMLYSFHRTRAPDPVIRITHRDEPDNTAR